ncbi:ATP synthase F1 subunit epsilon [Patescibacteria group bacterium]|nr:ATP synthase F1 subunit epsilon [Patescibacteria group bacterium]
MKLFSLEIITQETVIYQDTAESVTAPASEGEVTILAHHAPLFSKIDPGQITIRKGEQKLAMVTGTGFIDVSPDNKVTILVDSATRLDEIDIRRAEEAKQRADELLNQKDKLSRTEILRAEASLRKAVLELKVSRTRRRRAQPFSPRDGS